MTTNRSLKTSACILAFAVSVWTTGCVSTRYVEVDDCRKCEDAAVRILTQDGSEYLLQKWTTNDSCIVVQEGKVHLPSTKSSFWGRGYDSFSGTIPADSIDHRFCEVVNVPGTILGYALWLGVVVFPVIWAISLSIH